MGQAWGCHRCRCRRKRPDDFTFSPAFLEELKMISTYSERELEKVFEVFKKMDASNSGRLSREDFTKYRKHTFRVKKGLLQRSSKSDQGSSEEESHVPPMEDRLWMLFDPNGQGFVTFRDFVEVTSALSLQGPREAKIRHAYKMMDFDADGRVGEHDIREYLTRITKLSQTKENLAAYVSAHKQAMELDGDYVGIDDGLVEDPKKQKKMSRLQKHMTDEDKARNRLLQKSRTRTRTGDIEADIANGSADSKTGDLDALRSPSNGGLDLVKALEKKKMLRKTKTAKLGKNGKRQSTTGAYPNICQGRLCWS
eukprot:INCI16115.2.p1 GENE.INCI16115.2~~INCI16115.2.p1  ORF type:complete len:310 (+),score=59.94 INCI16115.2:335-1264(+)